MDNSKLYYIYRPTHYVLSLSQDQSIAHHLKEKGAKTVEIKGKSYWTLTHEVFESVLVYLEAVGYRAFGADTINAQAAYRVQTPKAQTEAPIDAQVEPQLPLLASKRSPDPSEPTLTVAEVNQVIEQKIKDDFPDRFWVRGEISGMKDNIRGHVYFELIESNTQQGVKAKIPVIIWTGLWAKLREKIDLELLPDLKDGVEIRVKVEVSFYKPIGKLSLIICEVDAQFAEGEFIKKKTQIEEKLEQMGLLNRNSALPRAFLPLRLAVFSNEGAAGWGDFIRILSDSAYPFVVTVFRVALQGKTLEASFLDAFRKLRAHGEAEFDYGVVIRGGGGVAELADFNNQAIAEAIARSPLKFIIGIGHEKDRTVLDEIAEREPTPTAVAKVLVDRIRSIDDGIAGLAKEVETLAQGHLYQAKVQLKDLCYRYSQSIVTRRADSRGQIDGYAHKLVELSQARLFEHVSGLDSLREMAKHITEKLIEREAFNLANCSREIKVSADSLAQSQEASLKSSLESLKSLSALRMERHRSEIAEISAKVRYVGDKAMTAAINDLDMLHERFEALHPKHCFERGFVMLQSLDGKRVRRVSDVVQGQRINALLSDGKLLLHIDEMEQHKAKDDDTID